MRISSHDRQAIKETIKELDSKAKVYLFGSRTDDTKRGGDIDLLILSDSLTERDRRTIRLKLFDRIGEQKIDLIIASDATKPFVKIALAQGILL